MFKAAPSLMLTLAIALVASPQARAEITWQSNLRSAHAEAQRDGKLLLLHFYSDDCTWCEKLEQGAFQEPQVGQAIHEHYVPVKVHANSSPKLAEMFKVTKFPTDVIVTVEGKTLAHSVSPQSSDRYIAMLRTTASTVARPASPPQATIANAAPAVDSGAPTTRLATPTTTQSAPPANAQAVPGYAANPAPVPPVVAENNSNNPINGGLMLPGSELSRGTSAQFVGSRGPSLEMPDVAIASTPETNAAPASNAPSAANASVASSDEVAADKISATVTDTVAIPETRSGQASTSPTAPPTQPELAMQGFCPVTVMREDRWVEGKPEYGVIHLGKLYMFQSEECMQAFLSDPIPYTPVLNEIDAVVFFEERRIVPGKREWGLKDPIYNRMFFFADEASMNHFFNQYERYTRAAIEVMDQAVKDANPGT